MPDDDLHRLVSTLRRLLTTEGESRLVILLGAGMTVSAVPGVARLTRLAREFSDQVGWPSPRSDVNEPMTTGPGVQRLRIAHYAEALQFIREVRGTDGVRAFLQQSTMHALDEGRRPEPGEYPLTDQAYGEMEHSPDGWTPTEGLTLLADILRAHSGRIHTTLLTTNFDPLLEVALRRAGLRINSSYGVRGPDDPMHKIRNHRTQWTVVHLHGTCLSASLHQPATLKQPHDEVEDWLANQLRGSHLLVLGYSGWDGMIQRVMQRHFGRNSEDKHDQVLEVLWAVYENPANHPHVDPDLAEFFERYRLRGVTPYYGIDRDHLLRTLTEELNGRPSTSDEERKAETTGFYQTVKVLNSDYGFGMSQIRPDTVPAFVFWPHRLRAPHLIHGVHALAAALFSKLGIPIELHLDDTEMSPQYAERTAGNMTDAVYGWFEKCGATEPPKIFRVSELMDSLPDADRWQRLWSLTRELFSTTNSAFDALIATKIATASEAEGIAIAPTQAHRLLRPIYTWLALDDALRRHGMDGATGSTVITLGGIDEAKMWDLWKARHAAPGVASIFVPRLEGPTEGANLWQYSEFRRDTPYGVGDLQRLLLRSANSWDSGEPLLEWVFNTANRLAVLASDGAISPIRGKDGSPMSWSEASEQLSRNPAVLSTQLAQIASEWLLHDPQSR